MIEQTVSVSLSDGRQISPRCCKCQRPVGERELVHGRFLDPRVSCSDCGPLPDYQPIMARVGRRLVVRSLRRQTRRQARA